MKTSSSGGGAITSNLKRKENTKMAGKPNPGTVREASANPSLFRQDQTQTQKLTPRHMRHHSSQGLALGSSQGIRSSLSP